MTTPSDGRSRKPGRPRAAMTATLATVVVAGLMVAFTPGLLLVLVGGMLPAFAALVTDRGEYRFGALTVAAMNLAGCMPYLLEVWSDGSSLAAAVAALDEPWPWAVMYLAAAGGWALLWIGPFFARLVVAALVDVERRRLERIQASLVAEWGRGVIEGPPAGEDKPGVT